MEHMSERIKFLRTEILKLTGEKFAEQIGLTKQAISRFENGGLAPSAQTIAYICDKYHVRREWLETGEGEIFNKDAQTEDFSAVLSNIENSDDDFIKEFLKVYVSLDDTSKAALKEIALRMSNKKSWQE